MTKPTRAALYLRVSTDRQTTENQATRLAAVAAGRGWNVVATYEDFAISGTKGRAQRKGLDGLLKAAARHRFDVVMAWSIDRLGRSLIDLLDTLKTLEASQVDLYLDQQAIDTTTPAGRAMFQMVGVFAEFERSIISERVKAGLNRAKAEGKHLGRYPPVALAKLDEARAMLANGTGVLKTAKTVGVGTSVVQGLKRAMSA